MTRLRSYSMDWVLNNSSSSDTITLITQIPVPTDTFVFLDEHEMTLDDGVFAVDRNPASVWINLVSDRHSRGANFSFVDGHCVKMKWKADKIFKYQGQPTSGSGDLEDLRKIQAAFPPRLF